MKTTNDKAIMKSLSYSSPSASVMEFMSEGVLCSSTGGSSANNITLGEELTDYEQIF